MPTSRGFAAVATVLLAAIGYGGPACAESLESALAEAAPAANPKMIDLALQASRCTVTRGMPPASRLAIIDYSRPSTEQRLWVFDLDNRTLLFKELVAHGRNSGENLATHFSNADESLSTSIGLYRTLSSYSGHNGYSLRMRGLEAGFNDHALERAIVIHGAAYVSAKMARQQGRIGRSWGCPAVRTAVAHRLIDTLKDGQLVFSYYPDQRWLGSSSYLNCGGSSTVQTAKAGSAAFVAATAHRCGQFAVDRQTITAPAAAKHGKKFARLCPARMLGGKLETVRFHHYRKPASRPTGSALSYSEVVLTTTVISVAIGNT